MKAAINRNWLLVLAWLALGLWAVGCSSSVVDEAGQTDANGYLCLKCQARFYTGRALFAERCPACQSTDIKTVVGFVCEKDQNMVIAPGGRDSVPCDRCGGRTTAIKMPREAELKAWGAEEKGKTEVLL